MIEAKVVDEKGEEVQHDGEEMGELLLRGPWITDEYYREPEKTKEAVQDGWLRTGDIVTVDEEGFIKIVDRTNDLIKSGGEWISSVDLENALMAHEAVFEAAVIAVPHEKWQERPVAFIVLKEICPNDERRSPPFLGASIEICPTGGCRMKYISSKQVPKTSVGKFLKRELREIAKEKIKQ